jgi:cytoskeletal protein CcmA (bactofilin family)
VGQGLSLSGDITACDLLIVEGSVQVTLTDTRAIEIAETGRFTNGKAAVEEATISGVYQGELTVRGRLLVRGTGRVDGSIRYGELEVERGGRLAGSIEILQEPAPPPAVKSVPTSEPAPAPASKSVPASEPAKAF